MKRSNNAAKPIILTRFV